ncbi:hypothetical protein LMG29542_08024 [Paraburkholderia humisilvae]|uniref:Uncharacterized protein n=2 Tax=Paraburkholderia humisilvae TaxID=627669 RepID=A0A6J5FBL3_9BURK|nr:hypothetical protein LMG29542_08024 [Paraburkholderia humisilvae]
MREKIFDNYLFIPIIGLPGAGVTETLDQLEKNGEQTVSIDELLGTRGMCIQALSAEVLPTQEEFDSRLVATFRNLDRDAPVYIGWKPTDVFGVKLPPKLVDNVRRASCVVLPRKRQERLARVLNQYATPELSTDTVVEFLSPKVSAEALGEILAHAKSSDKEPFPDLLACVIERYFDPEYIDEICRFNGAFVGNIDSATGQFDGKFLPNLTREKITSYVI